MLESRLETDIDTSFIYFEQENDRKRKAIEVSFDGSSMPFIQ